MSADVDWNLQNPNTGAGLLNSSAITTVMAQDGYRFWGSRTCSDDPLFAFESAVRTADVLSETIAKAHLWALDKPLSRVLFDDIVDGINARFRQLKTGGYIVDAHCSMDHEKNTPINF